MKKIYTFVLIIFCLSVNYAQYTLEVEQTPYIEIENGTSITNGLVWEELEGELPLGFNFTLEGETFNRLYLTQETTEGLLLPSIDFPQVMPIICTVVAEYADRNAVDPEMIGQTGGVSDVSYATIGEPGERVFILQYKNLGFENEIWENNSSNDYMNFQLRLYESSNQIAFHFGQSEINYPEASFEDVSGPAMGIFSAVNVYNSNGFLDFLPVGYTHLIMGDNTDPYLSTMTASEFINGDGDIFYTGVPNQNTMLILNQNLSTIEMEDLADIKILNNPVLNNMLELNNIETIRSIDIYDVSGQKVITSGPKSKIDINALASGIYLLNIKTTKGVVSKKFIKK
ncbi:T9SS type A sorting domain-containing protein [Flavobacteriaceae bacterium Ap0902]|nr:T9SS type A sorting domain-containing protein [Flavobacteriaceae bacterium Ap0902]